MTLVETMLPVAPRRLETRKIRVVHLVSTLNIGGLEKVVFDLVRCSDKEAFDVRVLCVGEVGALGPDFERLGVPVEGLHLIGQGTIRTGWRLARRLKQLQIDVLHTHNPTPHAVGAIARQLASIPVLVHTKHGQNYPGKWQKVLVNRVASWFSDRVVPVSRNAATISETVEGVSRRKISVIHNGIDVAEFASVDTLNLNPLQAIHVARLSRPKDFDTLLKATRLVARQEPSFELQLVGDGPERQNVERLCDELNLRDNVKMLGFRSDVRALLQSSGLAILSTMREGLSITLLEAMASALPVVATNVGGNPELVEDGKTGLLVPPQSPEAMARAMLKIIQTPGLAEELGRGGRRRVEEEFNLRTVVRTYESLYRELLAKRGKLLKATG
jgi:glycosyltransferase involved in cell wall biosynthesis